MALRYAAYSHEQPTGILILLGVYSTSVLTPKDLIGKADKSIVQVIRLHYNRLGIINYVPKLPISEANKNFDLFDFNKYALFGPSAGPVFDTLRK